MTELKNNHSVKLRYKGELMGSKEGVPCHSLKHAQSYAKQMQEKHGPDLITEIVSSYG